MKFDAVVGEKKDADGLFAQENGVAVSVLPSPAREKEMQMTDEEWNKNQEEEK